MKKRTKQIIVLVLSIVAIIGSVSYALWSKNKTQDVVNRVKSGCFDVDIALDDVAIGLGNTYPITDEDGNNLTPYVVTLKNKCTIDAKYDINLNLLEVANPMNDSSIKVSVDEEAKILTNYTINNYDSNTYRGSYTIYSGTLRADKYNGENGQSKTHNIRLWMDENTSENEAEKKFMAKIIVDATPTTLPDPGKLNRDKWSDFTISIGRNNVEKIYTVMTNEVPAYAISSADVSKSGNSEVMAWIVDKENNGLYELYIGSKGGILAPEDSSKLFSWLGYDSNNSAYLFINVSLIDLTNLDISKTIYMSDMFYRAGQNSDFFEIKALENWDVSKVTNMSGMFRVAGNNATEWSIGDLSNWNVSNVTDMEDMFSFAGRNATTWSIGDISNWNVSNVTDMSGMFDGTGSNATKWSVGDLSNWDVSKVTNMSWMFTYAGETATEWSIGDLSNWDVSKVTNMSHMFAYAGDDATTWSIGDISNWNVSNVTDMSYMFYYAGSNANYLLDLNSWRDRISQVQSYNGFNTNVQCKVISPFDDSSQQCNN